MAAEDRKSFLLRIPPDLWKELEKWAADELRSVNGQIEYLLRQAVQRRKAGATLAAPTASTAIPTHGKSPRQT
jgi:hypothetical protein